jgi:PAS domain S-box-containing protein
LVILKYPGILPALYIEGYGATPAKAYAELFVIILSLITLFALGKDVKNRDVLTYKYIFISVMIAVTTDISLALYESKLSFIRAFGHVSKTAFFLYLFRGTVSSAIRYPYKELENAHTYLSKILNGLPIGLLTFDYDRNLISANTAAQKMLGYTRDGQTGLPEEEFSKKAYSIIKDLTAKNSGNQDLSGKIVKAENLQGENINLRVSVQNFGDGNYMYLLAEAKREQELENLQLQTQTVLNALTNLVLMMDKNRKIIMCNKALSETFHIPEKDVLGMDISEFGDMVNCSRREILLRRPKPNDGPREKAFEASFITPLGEKREVVFHFAPVYNIETELIGYICIGVDVTTMKTEQEKLRQQEKLAVLGQMAAGLVHEIKNPLTAIRGFSQIIKNETLDDRIRQYADIMETEADCVNGVVSDFLAFAKPRPPALRPLSLNRLVNSMSLMLESQFFIKGIKLKIEISPEEKPVMLDEDQIKQVILNMVRNAIDASSDAKEPQVVLKTEYKGDSEEMAVIISDNGRGISPEEMVNIGTPFYTTKDKGTGLGLSICFQIVKQHSGRIDIDARIGVGSTFSIMLPYIRHN